MNKIVYNLYQGFKTFKHTFLIANLGFTSYCKHTPSCSQHFAQQVKKQGLFKGGWKGLKRILTCY